MKNVLVAEDNIVNRELLRELLELRGFNVTEASDGEEALRTIELARPDILLLDLGMPHMDGFAVLQYIRANPRMASLPVLAVTAYAMQGDRERIISAGFDGYISKPVDFAWLIQEMDRLLSRTAGKLQAKAASATGDS